MAGERFALIYANAGSGAARATRFLRRPPMHRHALIAIITVLGFLTLDVSSNPVFALGHTWLGSHSKQDIQNHCDAAGGIYFESGGTYGCWGPGGDVTCSEQTGTCYGTCEKC